jgi:hypothetical protein
VTRLDVITDIGVFVLEIDPAEYVVRGDQSPTEDELFALLKRDVKAGGTFYGWTPYEDADATQPSALSIENGAQIKALRLYEYQPVGVKDFGADVTPTPANPYPFTCFGEYLGNKLKITGVAFKTPTTEYLLPVFVNEQPATEYMKPTTLSQQIQLSKEAEGLAPTEYIILIPDPWLDNNVAVEYITDYVREVEPMTKVEGTGKATAWSGWNEK